MLQKKLKFITAALLCFGLTGLQAQQAVPATGGYASGSGGTAGYTVGQVSYTVLYGSIESITQGVQQPYEILVEFDITEAQDISLICDVYPIPSTDIVNLKIENYSFENLSYQLYELSGKIIENCKITNNETTISLETLAETVYFLKIYDSVKEIKSFKIIKNQ